MRNRSILAVLAICITLLLAVSSVDLVRLYLTRNILNTTLDDISQFAAIGQYNTTLCGFDCAENSPQAKTAQLMAIHRMIDDGTYSLRQTEDTLGTPAVNSLVCSRVFYNNTTNSCQPLEDPGNYGDEVVLSL